MKKILFFSTFLFPSLLSAQLVTGEKAGGAPPVPSVYGAEPWEDPMVVSINRDPARATAYSFTSEQEALTCKRDNSPRVMSLNGEWDFSLWIYSSGSPETTAPSCLWSIPILWEIPPEI